MELCGWADLASDVSVDTVRWGLVVKVQQGAHDRARWLVCRVEQTGKTLTGLKSNAAAIIAQAHDTVDRKSKH